LFTDGPYSYDCRLGTREIANVKEIGLCLKVCCPKVDRWRLDRQSAVYSVSQKIPLGVLTFFIFVHKRLRIFNRFFTHLLYVPTYARLQIFIQLSRILTKLCHTKRDYPVHIICSKCPTLAETHALTRLRKSLIALLIVVCGK